MSDALTKHAAAEKAWSEHRRGGTHRVHEGLAVLCPVLLLRDIAYAQYTKTERSRS